MKRVAIVVLLVVLGAGALAAEDRGEWRFGTDAAVRQVRPERPAKVKVKRHQDGTYSWEITGESAEEIIGLDKRLRELIPGKK